MDRLFLDANVLFSAAYGSPKIGRLWNLADDDKCKLLASHYVIEEARRNLAESNERKRLVQLLNSVERVGDFPPDTPCPIDLPDKDIPVLCAAIAARASHLLSGDVRHFGPYFGQVIQGVHIMRPATYLE